MADAQKVFYSPHLPVETIFDLMTTGWGSGSYNANLRDIIAADATFILGADQSNFKYRVLCAYDGDVSITYNDNDNSISVIGNKLYGVYRISGQPIDRVFRYANATQPMYASLEYPAYVVRVKNGSTVTINGQIQQEFSYKPLYNLHSSNQNFTLTTIGKTPNDGSAQITAPISDIMSFSEQSRLRAYIQNIKDNDRFVKMFTLNEHKYIGIKIDTYTNGVYEGKIGFYIDGVRQVALDLNFLSNSIFDANNLFPYFLAISVDYDNGACLPTIVYDWSDTGLTDYQCENYTAVNELYEYLYPFFGTVINPENPDIPIIDPTPTTDCETGGDGSWWTPDYEVGVPEIYEYGVADCGFLSLYRMTEAQMRNLASYFWSDDFLDNVKKFFNDPMQMIVCARMIPYTPNSSQNTSTIKAGNVDTTCVGYKIDSNNQYTKIDCGQVRVEPRGDTYMDYSPYCSASIYLPFVGVRPLDVDLIMGHDIGVEYNCDCLTGQSVCFVKIDKNVAYSYECTIGTDIPISSQSYGNVIGALSSALTIPIFAGTMLATGGMSAPMMPTMLASASIGVDTGTSIAQNTRETISHSGNVTGIGGMLSYKKPILYMEYTNPINAKDQKHFLGAPAHKNRVLKNCSGLTIVKQIFIELEEATDDEKKELSAILESGVIV